jgi:hypothetical protein
MSSFITHPIIFRVNVNKETPHDLLDNRYTRSRALLADWLEEKIFLRDPLPSIYPYLQDYQLSGSAGRTRKDLWL